MEELQQIDINTIIDTKTKKDKSFKMVISPLAPLSVCNIAQDIYTFSTNEIEFKILALIENILGFYLPKSMVKEINDKKKGDKFTNKIRKNKNNYIPLFYNNIDVKIINGIDYEFSYLDNASTKVGRPDSDIKTCGTLLLTDKMKKDINTDPSITSKVINKLGDGLKEISMYYNKLKKREYYNVGDIIIECNTTPKILELLKSRKIITSGYLGNSDSLVDVEFIYD